MAFTCKFMAILKNIPYSDRVSIWNGLLCKAKCVKTCTDFFFKVVVRTDLEILRIYPSCMSEQSR